jgi:hypothetical protein
MQKRITFLLFGQLCSFKAMTEEEGSESGDTGEERIWLPIFYEMDPLRPPTHLRLLSPSTLLGLQGALCPCWKLRKDWNVSSISTATGSLRDLWVTPQGNWGSEPSSTGHWTDQHLHVGWVVLGPSEEERRGWGLGQKRVGQSGNQGPMNSASL